ncbi:hypothetical protein [Actinomadura macrotermitis]|uniref:Uncharacterized protein n=1 Tax=Actinomadura macrotermitis TaxID=2585200 RepID=A0A7K0BSL6_9ACTN|nr:hypothetical protein [Actinomadura macrotermitis]MQY04151.1 hypothetical protein [Actinomadura macrotermitis]
MKASTNTDRAAEAAGVSSSAVLARIRQTRDLLAERAGDATALEFLKFMCAVLDGEVTGEQVPTGAERFRVALAGAVSEAR